MDSIAVWEHQARDFTLGWPVLLRCALRLGETLPSRRQLIAGEEVFFLTVVARGVLPGTAGGKPSAVRFASWARPTVLLRRPPRRAR
jgi:hypothetical protein